MSGLYIHIPFCKTKCNYCNFYSLASKKYIDNVVDSICLEISQRKHIIKNSDLETVYFGGGTPSLLNEKQISKLFDAINNNFNTENISEITIEANPEDINAENLNIWKNLGVNRLSLGIQSFNDKTLNYLGRKHTTDKAKKAIEIALKNGFLNLSIDIIYGVPTLSNEVLDESLQYLINNDIKHISAYSLTIENKTELNWQLNKKIKTIPTENQSIEQYNLIEKILEDNGYNHYEISNYCKPDYISKHNSNYWKRVPYLGIGPSAHSFIDNKRSWNINNLEKYICSANDGSVFNEIEKLSDNDIFNEYIMTSLRTKNGIELDFLKKILDKSYSDYLIEKIENNDFYRYFDVENNHISLNKKYWLLADKIISEIFLV